MRIDIPLGRIPRRGQRARRLEFLLNTRTTRYTGVIGKSRTCVLRNLAEDILAVDELQAAAPQRAKRDALFCEMLFLVLIHIADDIRRIEFARALETLMDSIKRARSCHDELIF